MKRLFKIIRWSILLLLLLGALGVWLVLANINEVATYAIEQGTRYALGVNTHVSKVKFSIFTTGINVNGFVADNPPGFTAMPNLFNLAHADVRVNASTLLSETIEVPLIELNNLTLNIEQTSNGTNFDPVLEHLKKLKEEAEPAPDDAASTRLAIRRLRLRNLVANVKLLPGSGKEDLQIKIDMIDIPDLQTADAEGIVTAEFTRALLPAILAAVLDKGASVLPKQLIDSMGKTLGEVAQSLGENSKKILAGTIKTLEGPTVKTLQGAAGLLEGVGKGLGQVGKGLEGATKGIGKGVEQGIKGVGKGIEGVGKGVEGALKGIFGGDKKDTEKKNDGATENKPPPDS